MKSTDRKLIASISIVFLGFTYHFYYLAYDSHYAIGEYELNLMNFSPFVTLMMFLGFIGIIWYGYLRSSVVKIFLKKDEDEQDRGYRIVVSQ